MVMAAAVPAVSAATVVVTEAAVTVAMTVAVEVGATAASQVELEVAVVTGMERVVVVAAAKVKVEVMTAVAAEAVVRAERVHLLSGAPPPSPHCSSGALLQAMTLTSAFSKKLGLVWLFLERRPQRRITRVRSNNTSVKSESYHVKL